MKKTLKSLLAGVLAVLLLVAAVPMNISVEANAQENEYVIHDDETITIDIVAGNFTAVKVVPECGGVYDIVIYSDNIVWYQYDAVAEKWHANIASEHAEDYSNVYLRRFLTPDNTYYFGAGYLNRERSGSVEIKLALVACECPHSVEYITTTDSMGSTCTKDGHTECVFCDLCGAWLRGKVIPASHKDANNDKICDVCKEENITVYSCETHDFESVFTVDVEPDCTNTGLKSRHCELCAAVTDVTEIPADGHNWSAFSEAYTKEATCTKDGKAYRHCVTCDAVESKITEKLGHDFDERFYSEVPPTCESVGFISQLCGRCRDTITTEIPATGHTWGEWKVTKAATVNEKGVEERVCLNCNEKEIRGIPMLLSVIEQLTTNEKIKTSTIAADSVFVLEGQTAASLRKAVLGKVKILDKASKEVADTAKLSTGMQLLLVDAKGNVLDKVTVVVPGDVDGDGAVKASDARCALRAAVKLDTLSECEETAADLDTASSKHTVNAADARYILRAAVGLENTKDWLKDLK